MKQKAIYSRCMASLTDLIVTLGPILIWDVVVLIVLAGFLPSAVMTFADDLIKYVIIVSFCVTNPLITLTYGKTLGQTVFDIRIKDVTNREPSTLQLALREFLGGIFIFGGYNVFYGVGLLVYLLLNFIVICVDSKSRGIVDFICHTKPISVVYQAVGTKTVKKKEEALEEKPICEPGKYHYDYDLHVHSKHSFDGEDTVEELFQKAKALNIKVMSITDLFSVKANFEADVLTKPYGVQYIPGIEMECEFEGYGLTILGYNIDYKDKRFAQIENEYLKNQREISVERIAKFEKESHLQLNLNRLVNQKATGIVTSEMIVQEVLDNPLYEDEEFLKSYQEMEKGQAYRRMFEDYFLPGKSCYVKKRVPSLKDVLEIIKETNGTSILAYPMRTCGNDVELIKRVLNQGVDGMEIFSPYHEQEDMIQILEIAKEMRCFVTCGSDYYGENELMIQIGDTKATSKYDKLLRIMIDRSLKKLN